MQASMMRNSLKASVVVQASSESRRAVLSTLFAGAALTVASSAQALTPVDLIDDRKVKERGFDLIYEARNLSLKQNERDGLTQMRTNMDATKARVKESEDRIDADLEPFIKKNYWPSAREELRRQIGTLRFDLNTLANSKVGKEDKKKAQELKKDFILKVEALDFALRSKNEASSLTKLDSVRSSLDAILAFVG
ncbi:MAG: hypothetical protein WDW38_003225 [Sanguina aurantia]